MSKKISVFVLASAGGQRKTSRTPFSFPRLVMSAVVLFTVSGCATTMTKAEQQVWRSSFSRNANGKLVRFIPPELWSGASWNGAELWSGASWDGDRNLNRLPVFDRSAVRSSNNWTIHYSGPIQVSPKKYPNCTKPIYWTEIVTKRGAKTEYYQINVDAGGEKGGIGRCWGNRYGRTVHQREFSKFPIGYWTEGEEYKNIRILDLGTPEDPCLKFRLRGGQDGRSWGEYDHCPGTGRITSASRRAREER
jgi:hypothetical protein